jgi:fluoride exporter
MIKQLFWVGLGGALGSMLRHMVSTITQKYNPSMFPAATFFTNLFGCFCIGCLVGYFDTKIETPPALKLLLITGFCGGYTTFSTFALENYTLWQTAHYTMAIFYALSSLILGIALVGLGMVWMR